MDARSGFSSRLGFVAAAAGSAVGLGNIWRFPYETGQNGGAAFLLIYLVCIFLIGFPLMVGEIAVGRKSQANPYGAYSRLGNKYWGLVGIWGVLCGLMILSFYNVVAGWAFGYFIQTSFGGLLQKQDFAAHFGEYIGDVGLAPFMYGLVFMALTALIVARGVQKGIEAASKVLMPLLFAILIILIIYAMTLEGAEEGLAFYLVPEFGKINLETVYSAMGQAFFSLSLGMGALITYGSYISKKENIVTAAGIVTIADSMVAFLAGLLIFPLVFSQGITPGAGPGLVFISLPTIFQSMGAIGPMVGGAFFLLLCVAALTSTVSLLEVPVAFLVDEFKVNRKLAVGGLAILIFALGVPSMFSQGGSETFSKFVTYYTIENGELVLSDKSWFDLIEDIFNNIGLPLGGFLLSLFISLKWKTHSLAEEISQGMPSYRGSLFEKFLNLMIVFICPIALGAVFFLSVLQKFFGILII
jgi:NSS family neurotransmitter:Na+ symporter